MSLSAFVDSKLFCRCHALRLLDVVVVLIPAWLIASLLGVDFLLSGNLPTGGDSASHLLYVWTYAHTILPSGHITDWMPEVFAGFAFLSYYFPLAFVSIAGLSCLMPFAVAMKVGMFAAAMTLPGLAWLGAVYLLRLPRNVAIWGVLSALSFLLHEQNSIWGGNLLSTLAGEFSYSYGMLFAMLTLMMWQRVMTTGPDVGRYWWVAAVLEAATGFSHGFALLVTGFATGAFLLDRVHFWRNLRLLAMGHGLAFFLLAGWLWPMLQMHGITIPNDALFEITRWQDLLPEAVQPVLGAGVVSLVLLGVIQSVPWLRRTLPCPAACANGLRHAAFMGSAALLGVTGFLAGSQIGVANIRFFPFVWLFGGLACAWVFGCLLLRLTSALPRAARLAQLGITALSTAAALAMLAWLGTHIQAAPDWGLWNHSGLETKPQFQRLSQLFPAITGRLDSPRLLFEHSPANTDVGSTRVFEALPMFLGQRPVLEGLYMESAAVGPAIYQLQSEVSTQPSSPLARFPSGSLDPDMAAAHMNFLYASQVLVRNDATVKALTASPHFALEASAAPFHVFKLKTFDTHLVDLVRPADRLLHWMPRQGWMEASFQWFRQRQRFGAELPVFHDGAMPFLAPPAANAQITGLQMDRRSITWHTSAIGSAHLVRMAWHPRWQLASKGKLYLAGPGLMLVVPEEADVVLRYGQTPVGVAGILATLVSLLVLAWLVWRDRPRSTTEPTTATTTTTPLLPWPGHWLALGWPALLIVAGVWFHLHNPERIYANAWELMRVNRQVDAAPLFDDAYAARTSEAKKEEALFWSAKAYEQAGKPDMALPRYRALTAGYHGYWLPESLYTQAQLEQSAGQGDQAKSTRDRLLREFPSDRWAQRWLTESAK